SGLFRHLFTQYHRSTERYGIFYIAMAVYLCTNYGHEHAIRRDLTRIEAQVSYRHIEIAHYVTYRDAVKYIFQCLHFNSMTIEVPIFTCCPAANDWANTFPFPFTVVRYPAFSRAYIASMSPMPFTSGTIPVLIASSEKGIPFTVSICCIGSADAYVALIPSALYTRSVAAFEPFRDGGNSVLPTKRIRSKSSWSSRSLAYTMSASSRNTGPANEAP